MTIVYGDGSKPWYLVNPKVAGKWMFIPLKMVLIGIDPYPYAMHCHNQNFTTRNGRNWKVGSPYRGFLSHGGTHPGV